MPTRARWTPRLPWLLLLFALSAALSACGIQGEPLPPLVNLPPVADIQAHQQGNHVVLTWAMPHQTTEGHALQAVHLGPARIYMAVIPGLHHTATPADFSGARRVASLAAAELQKPVIQYSLALPEGPAGSTAVYGVKLTNEHGHDAGFSNLVTIPLLKAPPPPAALTVRATEQALVPVWTPVPGAASYRVYRAVDDEAFQLLADVPANEERFPDEKFEFGKTYKYVVRSVAAADGFSSESADSPVAECHANDVFAPKAPVGLVAVAIENAAELSWEPNPEPDLAGYNVYRSDDGAAPRRLNAPLLVSPAFRDSAVKPGTTYSYTVTAVDQKGNESQKSQPAVVKR